MTYRLHAIHMHSYLLQYTDFERHQKHTDMQIYSIYIRVCIYTWNTTYFPMISFFTWGQSTEPQTQELQAGRQRLLQRGESVDVMIDFSAYDILWLQFFIEELGCYISGRFWYVSWESWPLKHLYFHGAQGVLEWKREKPTNWTICCGCSLADIPSDFITCQDLEQFQSFFSDCSLLFRFFLVILFCAMLSDLIVPSLLLIFYYLTFCRYLISVIWCYFSVQATNEVHGAGPAWRNEVHFDGAFVELDEVQHTFLTKWPCEFFRFWDFGSNSWMISGMNE